MGFIQQCTDLWSLLLLWIEKGLIALGSCVFMGFGLIALGGAAAMIFARNAVHSVIGFLVCMLALSGCYLSLGAEFMGVAQLLVYAGGIVVLFLFVVMLVELSRAFEKRIFHHQSKAAVAAVVGGAAVFIFVFWNTAFGPSAKDVLQLAPGLAQNGEKLGNAQMLSRSLFAGYLLPFEILSVILLVALVGAVVLAKRERV